MPATQSQIARTTPPYRLVRSTTEYKYGEVGEIIGKVQEKFLGNRLRGLRGGRGAGGVDVKGGNRYQGSEKQPGSGVGGGDPSKWN